jgi:hypothetical protein
MGQQRDQQFVVVSIVLDGKYAERGHHTKLYLSFYKRDRLRRNDAPESHSSHVAFCHVRAAFRRR